MSRTSFLAGLTGLLSLLVSCGEPTGPRADLARASATVAVTSLDPDAGPRNITLDVHIFGSGFDRGSSAVFALDGVVDDRVKVNQTSYVSGGELVANLSISADAVPDRYDVVVATASGKKGIGTERFQVLEMVLLGGLGGNTSTAFAINSLGQVAGRAARPDGSVAGFVWSDGVMHPLPMPATGTVLSAAIDDAGVVSGRSYDGSQGRALRWLPSGGTWSLSYLPTLPGYEGGSSYLDETNATTGDLVGFVSAAGMPGQVVLWRDGVISPVNVTGAGYTPNSTAIGGINDAGWISGSASFAGVRHAFIWRPDGSGVLGSGNTILLPRYGSGVNIGHGINQSGVVVGLVVEKRGNVALRWRPLRPDPVATSDYVVETLPGSNALAWDVADDGFIVGNQNGAGATWSAAGTLVPLPAVKNGIANPYDVRVIDGRHWVSGENAAPSMPWRATLWRVP
jgi:probable HAF family extracellular repeat protein